jgi:DNA repair exonuclease SbcCD nuclease subunit
MPKEFALMDTTPLSYLPKDFDYYAGGHVHIIKPQSFEHYKQIVYPGPLFPANFQELEHLSSGGFYIYDDGEIIRQDINIKNTFVIDINANHKSPEETESLINQQIEKKEFINTIVLMRVHGTLKTGKISDIKFNEIFRKIYAQGAFYVMKSTSKLSSEEFEEISIDTENIEDVEETLIKEHLGQIKVSGFNNEKELHLTKELMKVLESEKHEGEKVHEYEDRIRKAADKVLDI